MIHPFENSISILGPIVGAIIILALFFKFMNWLEQRGAGDRPAAASIRGILNKTTPITVHLTTGATYSGVCLVGFTKSDLSKDSFPHGLHGMAILEHPGGARTLVHAKLIRMIEIPPEKA